MWKLYLLLLLVTYIWMLIFFEIVDSVECYHDPHTERQIIQILDHNYVYLIRPSYTLQRKFFVSLLYQEHYAIASRIPHDRLCEIVEAWISRCRFNLQCFWKLHIAETMHDKLYWSRLTMQHALARMNIEIYLTEYHNKFPFKYTTSSHTWALRYLKLSVYYQINKLPCLVGIPHMDLVNKLPFTNRELLNILNQWLCNYMQSYDGLYKNWMSYTNYDKLFFETKNNLWTYLGRQNNIWLYENIIFRELGHAEWDILNKTNYCFNLLETGTMKERKVHLMMEYSFELLKKKYWYLFPQYENLLHTMWEKQLYVYKVWSIHYGHGCINCSNIWRILGELENK